MVVEAAIPWFYYDVGDSLVQFAAPTMPSGMRSSQLQYDAGSGAWQLTNLPVHHIIA